MNNRLASFGCERLGWGFFSYYDGLGNLVQIKTPATDGRQVVKNFFYDGLGRVKQEQNPYFDTFSTTLSTPSATAPSTTYTYDALGRVTNVTHPDGAVETVTFNRGNISTFDANGHRKDYFTDALDRITKITEFNFDDLLKDGTIYQYNTTYGYDAADQLVSINDTYGNQYRFTYDKLGRRIRLNDPDIGEWNYTYDLAGNLVSQAGGGGNLVSGDGFYREYNALNQLVLVRNGSGSAAVLEQYSYDPEGMRVRVWRNDSAQTTIYTPFRELMQIRNTSGVFDYTYIYDGSTLVARVNPDGTKWYYHPDHLGSTTLITDESGAIVEETFYEPFGNVTSGGTQEVKLYTGQYADALNCQYYYGARYYNPTWGRFMQYDPLYSDLSSHHHAEIKRFYNPQRMNIYSYVLNNPYRYTDPTGLWTLQLGGSGSAGAGVGGTFGFGIIFGYSEEGGFQIGHYGSYGAGIYGGASISLVGEATFTHNDYIKDVVGESETLGLSVGEGLVGGFSAQPEKEEEEKPDSLKGAIAGQLGAGVGIPVAAYAYNTHTLVGQWFGERSTTEKNKDLRWFYNPDTGTYTWRVDGSKPEGYEPIEGDGQKTEG
jgi:RHS repeat-associated protein